MKLVRVLSFVLGLGALGLTVNYIYPIIHFGVPLNLHLAWVFVSLWPRNLISILSHPQAMINFKPIQYTFLGVHVAIAIFSIILAKLLNRSRLDWFVLSLIFPFALTALALLKPGDTSSNPYGGFLGEFFAALTSKSNSKCGKCGKEVPLSSRAGQHCPFCGAYWSFERTTRR